MILYDQIALMPKEMNKCNYQDMITIFRNRIFCFHDNVPFSIIGELSIHNLIPNFFERQLEFQAQISSSRVTKERLLELIDECNSRFKYDYDLKTITLDIDARAKPHPKVEAVL